MAAVVTSSSATKGVTKKRRFSKVSKKNAGTVALRRVARLAAQVKDSRVMHLYTVSAANAFPDISTVGTLYTPSQAIIQGDASANRTGNNIKLLRWVSRFTIIPGATQALEATVRFSVFIGNAGLIFASTPGINNTMSPVASTVVNRLIYQKYLTVGYQTATAPPGYPCVVELDLPLRGIEQHYNGIGVNVLTGPCFYVMLESSQATGTTAPLIGAGCIELFFVDT